MKLTVEDMIKQKLLDEQESVRDYQEYSGKIENKEINQVFKKFAEESALQARELERLLNKFER
ncbi:MULTISPECIES: hypothetical protein [Clostridium]|jgi:rubrerythrin|uniref:Uncharacterized protein n=5 Tax=Clostridium TaxID=1485 RepID=D8GPP6_CLOLD|nr:MULTISPECIES: hypothetical protein [Clostridium]ADK13955.1 hypothetical protein CLJU_c08870 [Clostridium ljungdahlii DSM 13528]AGY77185.1 hypothetical protein CAETHG_2982 [Clostridium autoethanogenum DSM 10061]ALU37328.1 Hypothetical protein CLAU_2901 [Clostridium autoethanogenum DSM 10061]AZV55864.1 hypothetical protein DMR38_04190 [Clostridium sp. AWRP]OAA87447.1 hypothetical protein WX45_03567 [Clostridium ljungdahlii DSM 13528]